MDKIRRRRTMYRKKRHPFRWILLVVVCIVLVFVGYSVAGPVMNFFKNITSSEPSSSVGDVSSEAPASSQTPVSSQPSASSAASSEPSKTQVTGTKAVWLPLDTLTGKDLDSFIALAKETGVNAVVVDIKLEDGTLTYASNLEAPKTAGAVADDAPDLMAALTDLKDAGIQPIGRMVCFKDPIAKLAIRAGAIQYKPNPQLTWLDASKANGGKSWLNPYSDVAAQYLIDIASEAVDMGFEQIMLEGVQFPDKGGSTAYYGKEAETISREEALSTFVEKMQDALQAKGAGMILSCPGNVAAGETSSIYGDGNPLTFGAKTAAVNCMPGELGKDITISGETFDDPSNQVAEVVEAVADAAEANAGSSTTLWGWVQAYDMSDSQVKEQVDALTSSGIQSVIYYNPDGSYSKDQLDRS
ncbi:putative glycoside hydrolase [[Clostridium] leptum]|nr:putative glycoside hydrolase [[Clostridium] leptum]